MFELRRHRVAQQALLAGWEKRPIGAQTTLELGLLVLFDLLLLLFFFGFVANLFVGPIDASTRKTDLAFVAVDSQDFDFDFIADFDDFLWVLDLIIGEFRDMKETFEVVLESDEDTEVGDLGDFATDELPRLVLLWDAGIPWIVVELFHPQGDTATGLVDAKDAALDLLALLEHFAGVTDLACPGHIRDVQQSIDTFFELDERTVVGQVANLASDFCVLGVALEDIVPRVGLGLLDTQRELLALGIDTEDSDVDLVADLDHFARVVDPPGPGHFADVHETFDAGFEFDERTVAHDIDDFARDGRADWELLGDVGPRVVLLLLESQSDLLLFAIDLKDLDFDFLVDGDHLGRVSDPFPAHIGNVEQTIDTTEVDERAEVGDVLDDTLADLTDFQFGHEVLAVFLALLLDEGPAADDDIASGFVDLEDFALHDSADVIADVVGSTDIDLASRQEDVHTDIDQQTTLDLAGDRTGDDLALLDRSHHLFPLDDLFGFSLAQNDHVPSFFEDILVFDLFDQNLDHLADLRRLFAFFPLVLWDRAFALESNVDDDELFIDFNNLAFDDLVYVELFVGVFKRV